MKSNLHQFSVLSVLVIIEAAGYAYMLLSLECFHVTDTLLCIERHQ